jgi:hypothetical protein
MKLPRLQILNLISSIVIGIVGSVVIVRTLLAGEGRNPTIWIFVILTVFSLGTAIKLLVSMYRAHRHRVQLQKHQATLAKNKTAGRVNPSDPQRNFIKERPMPVPISRDRNGRVSRR